MSRWVTQEEAVKYIMSLRGCSHAEAKRILKDGITAHKIDTRLSENTRRPKTPVRRHRR